MGQTPWFPFYPADWLSSTDISLMTPEQEGAYLHLLCHAWDSYDCGLPSDPKCLATLSRLGSRWTKVGWSVLEKFEQREGRLYNPRQLREWQIAKGRSMANSINGRKGADSKWRTDGAAILSPSENNGAAKISPERKDGLSQSQSQSQEKELCRSETAATTSEDTQTKRKRTRTVPDYPAGFERVWEVYPHKEAKIKALPNWNELNPDDALVEVMRAAVIAQAKAGKWIKHEPKQQLLHFQGWISGRRWEDVIAKVGVSTNGHSAPCASCSGTGMTGVGWDKVPCACALGAAIVGARREAGE